MKGFSTIKLVVLLGLLVGVYMLISVFNDKSRSKSYREELVEINEDQVTKILINSSEGDVEVFKDLDNWKVKVSESKVVDAKESSVTGFLSTLQTIKPGAIITKKQDKWKDYQVDSTGTNIKVYEGSDEVLDIVIGRFAMSGQNSYSTFVRLSEDDEVYNADNFMGISLSRNNAGFRDGKLFQLKKDSIDKISFDYPDSSFVLKKRENRWYVNDTLADSLKASNYLSGISYLSSNKFEDELAFSSPELSVSISSNGEIYQIDAMYSSKGWITHSNRNEDSYFLDQKLFEKVFKSRKEFFAE